VLNGRAFSHALRRADRTKWTAQTWLEWPNQRHLRHCKKGHIPQTIALSLVGGLEIAANLLILWQHQEKSGQSPALHFGSRRTERHRPAVNPSSSVLRSERGSFR
jgi:hypothetical protein